jgi:hypothetical protein
VVALAGRHKAVPLLAIPNEPKFFVQVLFVMRLIWQSGFMA